MPVPAHGQCQPSLETEAAEASSHPSPGLPTLPHANPQETCPREAGLLPLIQRTGGLGDRHGNGRAPDLTLHDLPERDGGAD